MDLCFVPQLHTIRLHIEVVFFVLPITMVGDVEHPISLHRLYDGLKIVLARWNVFQNDTVFDALAVCQGIAHAERVVEPGTKSVLTDVFFVLYVIAVLPSVFVDYADAKHVPDDITPVVKGTFGNVHTPADVITKP